VKEMEYTPKQVRILLDRGNYKGFNYYILNLGYHPTAYIEMPKGSKYYEKEMEDIDLDVHGGVTYADDHLYISENERLEGWFAGWDYAHYGDYGGYEEMMPERFRVGGKKWTTSEILEEVKHAIDMLEE
jgi:hypothetical protein